MTQPTPDREKAVESAITQIERQFGKGAIMKLGSREVIKVPVIPTGSLALDKALEGTGAERIPGQVQPFYRAAIC